MHRSTLLLLTILIYSCSPPPQADTIIINAKIWNGIPGTPFSNALAIAGDTLIAVGDNNSILKLATSKTNTINANGRLLIPGFNDAHIHFLGGSIGLTKVELSSATSAKDVDRITNTFISENPQSRWITGRGWQYGFYPGGAPSHESMNGIKTDKPLFIRAYDGHSGYANKEALKLAGITRETRFKGFGEIVFDQYGEPTGFLKESAMSLVSALIPEPDHDEKIEALKKGLKYAASLGITSAQNASGSVSDLNLFVELLKNNELSLRYAACFSTDDNADNKTIERLAAIRDSIGLKNKMIRADAIKFAIDGVIESHTAAMIGKYDDLSETDPLAVGQLSVCPEKYRDAVARYDKKGFRIYTHAIGDLGVREALNAYEYAAEINGSHDSRHRVEHIETISSIDIPRFSELGVMASMEPIHADPGTVSVWKKAIGNARITNSFPWASMLSQDAKLVYSSDWPAAISLNPIRGIHVAVNRRTPEGFPEGGWIPEQKINIEQALYAYTYMGAWSSFEENIKGSLEKGKLADLIILSDDLFTIDPMEIHKTKVILTMVGGKIIYQSEN